MKRCMVVSVVAMNACLAFAQWLGSGSFQNIQNTGGIPQNINVDVKIEAPARYQLQEGIAVAIQNVQSQGKPLTVGNVMKELNMMAAANDVKIPYCGGTNSKTKKSLEQRISTMIRSIDGGANPEPRPQDFANRTLYSKAYVAYKMSMVDDDVRETYAKKLGGLSQYKRDMANEANGKWKESFGSSTVNSARK